jgi:hypothetical protein
MQRPMTLTVFGILNIAFGALGVLCTPFSLFGLLIRPDARNPLAQVIQDNLFYRYWMIGSVVMGVIASAVLLTAGIGLLRMQNWGRLVSLGYAVYAIVAGLAGIVVTLVVLLPALKPQGNSDPAAMAGMIGGVAGGLIGGCVALVYPILLLIFLNRPKVRAACTGQVA